jgi:hypothetical protein
MELAATGNFHFHVLFLPVINVLEGAIFHCLNQLDVLEE